MIWKCYKVPAVHKYGINRKKEKNHVCKLDKYQILFPYVALEWNKRKK